MASPISTARIVKVADFELDLQSGELSRNGTRVVLAQQPFRLLVALIREPGIVLTREDLQRELWPEGTFVDFELGLNAAVKRLREALGDSATSPRFIETLPRRGYRFIATVQDGFKEPDRVHPGTAVSGVDNDGRAVLPPPVRADDASSQPAQSTRPAPVGRLPPRALKAGLIVLAATGLIAFTFSRGTVREGAGAPGARSARMTNVGTVRLAALSADGETVAYTRADGVQESLWIRKAGESNFVQLLDPVHGWFRSLTLSSDGFVYYNIIRAIDTAAGLHRVSIETGSIEKISDTAAACAFSPDGSRLAYVSTTSMGIRESHVVIRDANLANPRTLAVRRAPETFVKELKPAWSPDGTQLAVFETSKGAGPDLRLLLLDARDGNVRSVMTLGLVQVSGVLWLPDGDGLVVSARERRASPRRLWHVSIASGAKRPITHDLSDYTLAGVTPDGRSLVAVRGDVARGFWAAALNDLSGARQIAVDSGSLGGLEGIAWAPDDRLLYATANSENVDIWSVDWRTNRRRQLTSDSAEDYQPTVSSDGETVAFVSTRSGVPSIWSMSIDGSNQRQLTTGADSRPSFSPDGRWIAFQRDQVDTLPFKVWRVPTDQGGPTPLATDHTMRPAVSPDGKLIAHYWMTPEQWTLAVTAVSGGLPVRQFPLSPTHLDRVVRWSPDSRALAFIDGVGGVSNIWIQPLEGGSPQRLTNFTEGTMNTFDWSRDGSKLAWVRTTEVHDVVSIDLDAPDSVRR
jgi:Tol biopolymer transport system component/DNA-binding winged helix-turn-helix (wHTH) protein